MASDACASAISAVFLDGITPVPCMVAGLFNFDCHTSYESEKGFEFVVAIRNLFDRPAPYNPTTYGGYIDNPAWANDGLYDRAFKVGVSAEF